MSVHFQVKGISFEQIDEDTYSLNVRVGAVDVERCVLTVQWCAPNLPDHIERPIKEKHTPLFQIKRVYGETTGNTCFTFHISKSFYTYAMENVVTLCLSIHEKDGNVASDKPIYVQVKNGRYSPPLTLA